MCLCRCEISSSLRQHTCSHAKFLKMGTRPFNRRFFHSFIHSHCVATAKNMGKFIILNYVNSTIQWHSWCALCTLNNCKLFLHARFRRAIAVCGSHCVNKRSQQTLEFKTEHLILVYRFVIIRFIAIESRWRWKKFNWMLPHNHFLSK